MADGYHRNLEKILANHLSLLIRQLYKTIEFFGHDLYCGKTLMLGDTTTVPIWSEQPHYKHHSIRLKVRGEGNLSLAVERGGE